VSATRSRGRNYYPEGGLGRLVDSFDSVQDAQRYVLTATRRHRGSRHVDWYQVVDLTTGRKCKHEPVRPLLRRGARGGLEGEGAGGGGRAGAGRDAVVAAGQACEAERPLPGEQLW